MVEANKYGEYYRIEHHTYDFSINPSSYSTRKPNQQKLSYHLPQKYGKNWWQKDLRLGIGLSCMKSWEKRSLFAKAE